MTIHPPKTFKEFVVEALLTLLTQQESIMTEQENMNAALADFSAKFDALDAAVQQAVVDLTAAFNAHDDAAFKAATDKLVAMSAKADSDTAVLTAADAALHPTAPAPVAPAASEPTAEPVVA